MALISYRLRSLVHEVAACLTLKANWFNALTVKQWEIAHSFLRPLILSAYYAGYVIVFCGQCGNTLRGSSYITGAQSCACVISSCFAKKLLSKTRIFLLKVSA